MLFYITTVDKKPWLDDMVLIGNVFYIVEGFSEPFYRDGFEAQYVNVLVKRAIE